MIILQGARRTKTRAVARLRDVAAGRALLLAPVIALAPFIQGAAAAQAAEPAPDEIVVNATRGKCTIVRAGLSPSNPTLTTFAKGWPKERPVRILSPAGANYRCLAKIAFKLQSQGIRYVEFVDQAPAD